MNTKQLKKEIVKTIYESCKKQSDSSGVEIVLQFEQIADAIIAKHIPDAVDIVTIEDAALSIADFFERLSKIPNYTAKNIKIVGEGMSMSIAEISSHQINKI